MSDRMSDGLFVDLESSYQMDALHRRISVDELWRYFPAERAEVERLAHIERLEAERAKHAVLFEAAKAVRIHIGVLNDHPSGWKCSVCGSVAGESHMPSCAWYRFVTALADLEASDD